jgi:hypothetical protein
MLTFGGEKSHDEPEITHEQWVEFFTEKITALRNNTSVDRLNDITNLVRSIEKNKVTKEECGITDKELAELHEELLALKQRNNAIADVRHLFEEITNEQKRFIQLFVRKTELKVKAEKIQKYIQDNNLTYQECGVNEEVIQHILKK